MISLTLFSASAVTSIQYVCYLYEENKSGSTVNELRYRMFTKKNLGGDRLPSTLVLSIDIFSELFYFIYHKYKI